LVSSKVPRICRSAGWRSRTLGRDGERSTPWFSSFSQKSRRAASRLLRAQRPRTLDPLILAQLVCSRKRNRLGIADSADRADCWPASEMKFSAERSSFYLKKIVDSVILAVARLSCRALVLRGELVNDRRCSCTLVRCRCVISRFLRSFERQKYMRRCVLKAGRLPAIVLLGTMLFQCASFYNIILIRMSHLCVTAHDSQKLIKPVI